MATPDLQVQIGAFWASSGHQKPFKIEPEVFVPKIVPKICNNFTDTYNFAMKFY